MHEWLKKLKEDLDALQPAHAEVIARSRDNDSHVPTRPRPAALADKNAGAAARSTATADDATSAATTDGSSTSPDQ
jgi:hypothetical protein